MTDEQPKLITYDERAEDRGQHHRYGCRLEIPNRRIGARIDYLEYPTLLTVLFDWIPRLAIVARLAYLWGKVRVPDYPAMCFLCMAFFD